MAFGAATSTFTAPRATYAPGARRVRRARATVARASAVETAFHALPDGLKLEVQSMSSSKQLTSKKPPLVFVHGSYHAAWCWSEHFFEYFASRGHDCYALSMRGQGASDMPRDPEAKVAATLEQHADDVSNFCASLSQPPVLVGHSFGGLIAQRAMVQPKPPALAGLALLASVPPTGNGPMVGRFLRRAPIASIKITYAFIAGAFKSNAALCRECFFSEDLPEATLRKHMGQIATSCNVRLLDLRSLNDSLPLPAPGPGSPPVCVVGGEDDFVVDVEGLEETAEWGKTEAIVLKDTAHDLMLDTRWEGAAAALESWMEQKL